MKKASETLYSPDFRFFLKEQVCMSTAANSNKIKFFSRLDGKLLYTTTANKVTEQPEAINICREIHKTVKHYK